MENSIKKRVVITGSEGIIGSKLVRHLSENYEIIPLDIDLGHDLTDENFVREWFSDNKNLYALIVCHAYNPVPLERSKKVEPVDVSLNEIKEYLDVNVVSAFDVFRNFIKNNSVGKLIAVSSIYGLFSPKHHLYHNFTKPIGYSISKSGIVLMTKYLSTYYSKNYNINTVVFGGLYDDKIDKRFVKKYNRNVPMGRMMNIEEVPSVFDFLLDDKSSYVNGTEIIIDGGWTSW